MRSKQKSDYQLPVSWALQSDQNDVRIGRETKEDDEKVSGKGRLRTDPAGSDSSESETPLLVATPKSASLISPFLVVKMLAALMSL